MDTIGVVGGMSFESTAQYLRLINEGTRDRLGGLHSARLLVSTVDFARVERLQRAEDWATAGRMLAEEARVLEAGGARLLLVASNTMHRVFDTIAGAVTVPVVHVGDVTAQAVRAEGLARVGLLATRYTMEQRFYRDRLAEHGIDSVVPDASSREEVQRIIYEELCVGRIHPDSRRRLVDISQEMLTAGAEGIVLGCTELELILDKGHLDAPLFPTTALHCRAALDLAFGRERNGDERVPSSQVDGVDLAKPTQPGTSVAVAPDAGGPARSSSFSVGAGRTLPHVVGVTARHSLHPAMGQGTADRRDAESSIQVALTIS